MTTTTFPHPLDGLTRELTAFESFSQLCNTAGTYRPTILPRDRQHIDLADGYDAYQAARGDARRAWRGIGELPAPLDAPAEGGLSIVLGGVPAGSGLYAEWLRVIHAINGTRKGDEMPIGSPLNSYNLASDGAWVEEYPEYRVILRYTEWGHAGNYGTIQAKTEAAARVLAAAVSEVRGE